MNVGQVIPMKGLSTVAANKLDGWIMEVLQPSTTFLQQVKDTVKKICDFLKEDCFEDIRVLKTVKGGSAGKGTALQNNSDADVVLFLSCFCSYQDQRQERKHILDLIKERLHACRLKLSFTARISEPRYKIRGNKPRSLSLTIYSTETSESIDVDILPAYDALGHVRGETPPDPKVYVELLNANSKPGEFSPCFTELQKKFVKRCPAKLKNLLRLVKHWYKELKSQHSTADLPPKYALELLTIYAWEEGTGSNKYFVTAEGFRTVLELLCQYQEICIYWEWFYSLQHRQIGSHVKKLLQRSCPVILDPAEPTGILGQGNNWTLMAQEAARHLSLPCINTARPWNVQPARPVTIEVRQLTGTSLRRTVSPRITIRQLKEEIEKAWNIPWYRQHLAQQESDGSILHYQETLASHGIFYNTTLILLQTEPQEMEVFVKDPKNKSTTYTVRPTDTVRQLKLQVQARQGVRAEQQEMIYDSETLDDRYTLAHYNVQPRSIISMVLQLRGGADPQFPVGSLS